MATAMYAQAPSPVSVTPSSGSGTSQTFSFRFSHAGGYANIASAQVDVAPALSAAGACYFYFDRVSRYLYLANDAGTWMEPVVLGASATRSNSQCSVSAAGSSVTESGTDMVLNLALTFTTGYTAGMLDIWMLGATATMDSGWVKRGYWGMSMSVTPASGSGKVRTFSFGFAGNVNVSDAQLLVGPLTSSSSCYFYFSRAARQVWLASDGGVWQQPPVTLPGTGVVQNSQCSLDVAASSVTDTGSNVTVNLALSFKPAFAGWRDIWMLGQNGAWSGGWENKGTWMVPSDPTADWVTPASGGGMAQTFTFTYSNAAGASQVTWVEAVVGPALSGQNSCYVGYLPQTHQLVLASNGGTWLPAAILPGSGTLSNSQCDVNVGGSSVTVSGTTVTMSLALTFKAAFAGPKGVWMHAVAGEGDSYWQSRGAWTVGDFAMSVAPASPATVPPGGSKTYTVAVTPGAGFSGAIALSALGLPTHAVATFGQQPLTVTAGNVASTTMTVSTAADTPVGVAQFTVRGVSGGTYYREVATTMEVQANQAPSPLSVSPNMGSGTTQTFTATVWDVNGADDVQVIYLKFIPASFSGPACGAMYMGGYVYLVEQTILAGVAVGSGGATQGTYCRISSPWITTIQSEKKVLLSVTMTFTTPAFSGDKLVYLKVQDQGNLESESLRGTWTVAGGGGGGGGTVTVQLVTVTPSTLMSGQQATIWVNLSGAAPAGGTSVSVSSTNPAFGVTGCQMVIAPGASAGNCGPVTAGSVSGQTDGWVSASSGGSSGGAAVGVVPADGSQPFTLPYPLKGVTYFPRGHAFWRMLYDWYETDCTSSTLNPECSNSQTVQQIVEQDLAALEGKINLIHLYLWDQDVLYPYLPQENPPRAMNPAIDPGFTDWDSGGPDHSPKRQWDALLDFVAAAKQRHIWVHLSFATKHAAPLVDGGGNATMIGTSFGNWVNQFYDHLKGQENVLIWGLDKEFPKPNAPQYRPFWQAAYGTIRDHVKASGNRYQNMPLPGTPAGRVHLAVEGNFGLLPSSSTPVLAILSGYQWDIATAQQHAYCWKTYAGGAPDLYEFQLYHPNVEDLEANLRSVQNVPQGSTDRSAITLDKVVVVEYSTGTSMEDKDTGIGNGLATFGDALVPTTKAAGQVQWVTSALCLFDRLHLPASAHWSLYDSASLWEREHKLTGTTLAWYGYWGLAAEDSFYNGSGWKAAWTAFTGFNPSACPAEGVPAPPVVAVTTDSTYYTVNDLAKVFYTAGNLTSLTLSQVQLLSPLTSFACDTGAQLDPARLVGSCAYALSSPMTTTGTISPKVTGVNSRNGQSSPDVSDTTSVEVGLGPKVAELGIAGTQQTCDLNANPGCVLTVSRGDTLEVKGRGFSDSGGNTIELVSGGTSEWLWEGDGYAFSDHGPDHPRTRTFPQWISAQMKCEVPAGSWTLYVKSPNSGTRSNGANIVVQANPSCN